LTKPLPFHTLPQSTHFYFVRHGESVGNQSGRIQGREDSPLTETGVGHARSAGQWFADKSIELIYTSPLLRAHTTAQEIAKEIGLAEPTVLDDLIELDTGVLSGRNVEQLRHEDPELFETFRVHSWERVPGAESAASLLERAVKVWERLLDDARSGHRRLLCVTHGGTLQWLLKATLPLSAPHWMPLFPARNCGIFRLSVESTSIGANTEPAPYEGYRGWWDPMNFVPYE
jgi:broad specificity phosphatase PhoE